MRTFVLLLTFAFIPNVHAQTPAPTPEAIVTPAVEITAPPPAAIVATTDSLIPARTPVLFTLDSAVGSRTAVSGDFFQLKVAEDLVVNEKILVPKGTPATGEVIHAQKSGVFGKPGELLVAVRYIYLNGQKIKMRSFLPSQGKDSMRVAIGTSVFIGMFAAFIHGGEIVLPENTYVQALVAIDSIIQIPPTSITVDEVTQPVYPATPNTGDSK